MLKEIFNFGGVMPRLNAALLDDRMAQTALNCYLSGKDIRPLKQASTVVTPTALGSTIKSIYRIGQALAETQYWMAWTTDVNVVRGLIAGDTTERTYYTGDGAPKMTNLTLASSGGSTYPVTSYLLGIPKPAAAPTCTPSSSTAPTETRVYVYTYVSAYGEEGRPSSPTSVTVAQSGTVNLSGMSTAPAGNYNITLKRIYRSQQTTTGDAILRFVAEIPVANTTYSDTIAAENLGEALETTDYEMPPSTMAGLIAMPNGIVAGFDGYDILFCEPFLPYAWPSKYKLTADYPIIGLGVFGTSLVVLTKGISYIISGTHPAAMSMEKIDESQACVSKRSIVSTKSGVIYATPNGLSFIGIGGERNLTEGRYLRDDWQALTPSSIEGYLHDDKYIGISTGGSFILDLKEGGEITFFDEAPTAGYADPVNGTLYLCIAGVIKKFNGGSAKTFTWKSKKFQYNGRTPPAFARVEANAYPVTFKLYWEGVLKHTQTVADRMPFALPSGDRVNDVEMEVTGTNPVRYMGMAGDYREFNIG